MIDPDPAFDPIRPDPRAIARARETYGDEVVDNVLELLADDGTEISRDSIAVARAAMRVPEGSDPWAQGAAHLAGDGPELDPDMEVLVQVCKRWGIGALGLGLIGGLVGLLECALQDGIDAGLYEQGTPEERLGELALLFASDAPIGRGDGD